MKITLFDYGAGNIHSLLKGLAGEDRQINVESDVMTALRADLMVLPGVGAFGSAVAAMDGKQSEMRSALADGLPCIGVCLGMQMLFERSEESPGGGIGLIAGAVERLTTARTPHMGWNQIEWSAPNGDVAPGTAYFANAYVCRPEDDSSVQAWTVHEDSRFASVVRASNTVGVQFHPEKSGTAGRAFLRDLVSELAACR